MKRIIQSSPFLSIIPVSTGHKSQKTSKALLPFAIMVLFLFLSTNLLAQSVISSIPIPEDVQERTYTAPIVLSNNSLCLFRINNGDDSSQIIPIISSDGGTTWDEEDPVFQSEHWIKDITAVKLKNGRICIAYRTYDHSTSVYNMHYIYSDIESFIFSEPTIIVEEALNPFFSQTPDGIVWLAYIHRINSLHYNVMAIKSTDGGISWQEPKQIGTVNNYYGYTSILSLNENTHMAIYTGRYKDTYSIYYSHSTDAGTTWQIPVRIMDVATDHTCAVKNSAGDIYITYELTIKPDNDIIGNSHNHKDVFFIKSTDNGTTWSDPVQFTSYLGNDQYHNTILFNDKPFVTFESDRFGKTKTWFGTLEESIDAANPPVVFGNNSIIKTIDEKDYIEITTSTNSLHDITNASIIPVVSGITQPEQPLSDLSVIDNYPVSGKLYFVRIGPFSATDSVNFFIKLIDSENNITIKFTPYTVVIPAGFSDFDYISDGNNISFNISMRGEIYYGRYKDEYLFGDAGFLLSAKLNNNQYAVGKSSTYRIHDFAEGNAQSEYNEAVNNMYIIKKSDQPFSRSWQHWKYATELGAKFYDGDNDGIYSPIDKNGNNQWDLNEDKPHLLGDEIIWSAYTDYYRLYDRYYEGSVQLGVDIQQTTYYWNDNANTPINNIVFTEYEITNSGVIADVLDSVYFGLTSVPVIGATGDDMVGTDTTTNTIYAYNSGSDDELGNNLHAYAVTILSGNHKYYTGETFTDNNNNNQYDQGIDTPLQYATNNKGPLLGIDSIPGAKNENPSSTYFVDFSIIPHSTVTTMQNIANNLKGKTIDNEYYSPCDTTFGIVHNENCELINPAYVFSGNPLEPSGWIDNDFNRKAMLINCGPFQLKKDEPVTIVVAYVGASGNSALDALRNLFANVDYAHQVYNSNYDESTNIENNEFVEYSYKIYPNYPNPFNPTTTLTFEIPEAANITIDIYNILGEKIETLIKKEYNAGVHSINWNASNKPSGVYIAHIKSSTKSATKHLTQKMLLLK